MQWFIKTFRKKVAIKIYFVTHDKRYHTRWVIPNSAGEVIFNDYAYKLNEKHMMLEGRTPVYVFHVNNAEPLNLSKRGTKYFNAMDFKLAIDSHVARDIITSSKGGGISTEVLILGGIMLLGFLAMFYLFNDKFNVLYELLQNGGA